MSFEWTEYLSLAESLLAEGGEAKERSAVSRSYYSAFCLARDWLDDNNQRFRMPPPGESHKAVWDTFDYGPERLKKRIAALGRRLRTSRNQADYDSELGNPQTKAKESVKMAKTVVDLLAKL